MYTFKPSTWEARGIDLSERDVSQVSKSEGRITRKHWRLRQCSLTGIRCVYAQLPFQIESVLTDVVLSNDFQKCYLK